MKLLPLIFVFLLAGCEAPVDIAMDFVAKKIPVFDCLKDGNEMVCPFGPDETICDPITFSVYMFNDQEKPVLNDDDTDVTCDIEVKEIDPNKNRDRRLFKI